MSDKEFVLALPEELLERALAANLDLRQVLIESLNDRLPDLPAETLAILKKRLPADQVVGALQAIQNGERVLGLHAGVIGDTSAFDDPLPDDFWLGDA
jgi:uncharacterized membrane protein